MYYGKNHLIPDTGSFVYGIAHTMDVEPIVLGKPSLHSFNTILETNKIERHKCIMIGDGLHTDIIGGINAGIDTCYMLGKNTIEDIKKANIYPKYIIHSLS